MFEEDLINKNITFNKPDGINDDIVKLVIYNNQLKKTAFTFYMNDAQDKVTINTSALETHLKYKFRFYQKDKDEWVAISDNKFLDVEFRTEEDVRYKFFRQTNSNALMIVFSGNTRTPIYNSIGAFSNLKVNRLHILDDFSEKTFNRALWYIGQNQQFNVMENVFELIQKIMTKLSISKDNVICAGTSKGGFAATHFSLKYGFRHVVIGSPTIFLGDTLLKYGNFHDQAMEISGGTSEKHMEWLNNLIPSQIHGAGKCDIHLVVGRGEWRYSNDVLPFMELVKSNPKIQVFLTTGNFDKHSEVSSVFRDYSRPLIEELLLNINDTNK